MQKLCPTLGTLIVRTSELQIDKLIFQRNASKDILQPYLVLNMFSFYVLSHKAQLSLLLARNCQNIQRRTNLPQGTVHSPSEVDVASVLSSSDEISSFSFLTPSSSGLPLILLPSQKLAWSGQSYYTIFLTIHWPSGGHMTKAGPMKVLL